MKVALVHNPRSGTAMRPSALRKQFASAGLQLVEIIDIADAKDRLNSYTNKKGIVVAAYGGDGTLNTVANIIMGTDTDFAPLAGGTLNHFTKDADISQDLSVALRHIKTHKPRLVDVAKVNDRIFLNNSNLGIYPTTLRVRSQIEKKSVGKWSAAIIASLQAFIRYRSYEVIIDQKHFRTPFIFVGNNDYALENFLDGGRSDIDKGILSVYIVADGKRLSLLWILLLSLAGKGADANELKAWKTEKVTIKTKKKTIAVSMDGERTVLDSPLTYSIVKNGLRIIS